MPAGVAPLVLPETAVVDAMAASPQAAPFKRGIRDEVSHLVAIALAGHGRRLGRRPPSLIEYRIDQCAG
jgi:hypothetical protein